MFQSPINNIVIKIDVRYLEDLTSAIRMANLHPGTTINPADYANIIGTVVSLPKAISNRREYKGFSTKDIKIGDTIIFRYDVVFRFTEHEGKQATFTNLISYKGNDFWLCDILKAFAVIRDDKIRMLNGYCMLENISKPQMIILPQHMKRMVNSATATLTHIRNPRTNQKQMMLMLAIPFFITHNFCKNIK